MIFLSQLRLAKSRLLKWWYTRRAKRMLGGYGEGLEVNKKCLFTQQTIVNEHCCFNGMQILGGGKVRIGRYFHSGIECMLLTRNHNYEGSQIPYDSTYIDKDHDWRLGVARKPRHHHGRSEHWRRSYHRCGSCCHTRCATMCHCWRQSCTNNQI